MILEILDTRKSKVVSHITDNKTVEEQIELTELEIQAEIEAEEAEKLAYQKQLFLKKFRMEMARRKNYWFDRAEAKRIVQFFEKELIHEKGEWAGKSVVLERWQKRILRRLFGWKVRNENISSSRWVRRFRTLYLEIARKNGKALALDTKILEKTKGLITIKDIDVGDVVFDENYKITKVVGVRNFKNRPCYKLEFNNDEKIIADENHEWLLLINHADKYTSRPETTREVYETKKIHKQFENKTFWIKRPFQNDLVLIKKITRVRNCNTKCIEVDGDSHLFLVGEKLIPTHNSLIASGLALYMLYADREPGAEIVCAAADTEQAKILYDVAKTNIESNIKFSRITKTNLKTAHVRSTKSNFKVLSSEAKTKHGGNASCAIIDELHVHPNRDLIDVLVTSMGARRQPLTIVLTTSGRDIPSVCWEYHEIAEAVRDGFNDDPSFLPALFNCDPEDDFLDPKNWEKANPNLDVSVYRSYLEQESKKAITSIDYRNTFRQLHMNIWISGVAKWMGIEKWGACSGNVPIESFQGEDCYIGLDLSATKDLTSMVVIFNRDDKKYIYPFFWMPEDTIEERSRKETSHVKRWVEEGFLVATDGAVVDYNYIIKKIEWIDGMFNLKEIATDKWNATHLAVDLESKGFEVCFINQTYLGLSGASKELEKAILSKRMVQDENPVMTWCFSNLVMKTDDEGNIKPSKAKSSDRIDGMVALINGLARAINYEEEGFSIL